jgi:hypothetical protein
MKNVVTYFLLFILFVGCKKYPEDPIFTKSTNNPFNGLKSIKNIKINGEDVTKRYSDSIGTDIRGLKISFLEDDDYFIKINFTDAVSNRNIVIWTNVNSTNFGEKIKYYFNKRKYIETYVTYSGSQKFDPFGNLFGVSSRIWEIKRSFGLFVIERKDANNNIIRIEFNKK